MTRTTPPLREMRSIAGNQPLRDCTYTTYFDNRRRLSLAKQEGTMPQSATNAPSSSDPNPGPNPNEKLVKVFDSEQESEALVVKGLLDSANIESDLTSAAMVQDTFPGLGGMLILVREDDAEAARNLIAASKRPSASSNNEPADDETAEIKVTDRNP
jgi:hypothetical protein